MLNLTLIEEYKKIEIFINTETNNYVFDLFEENKEVNSLKCAKDLIDKSPYEVCFYEGYCSLGYSPTIIAEVRATKIDKKTGELFWRIKDFYDDDYRDITADEKIYKIFDKNSYNDDVYFEWKRQHKIYRDEKYKLGNIAQDLK